LALVGWFLFLCSSIGYIVSSWSSGDVAALAGSVLFFCACLVFILPYFRRR
jgi:hypothetical protein